MACFRGDLGVYEPRRAAQYRSEEHTSELQSRSDLVCRLLLEKKKKHDRNTASVNAPRSALDRDKALRASRPGRYFKPPATALTTPGSELRMSLRTHGDRSAQL